MKICYTGSLYTCTDIIYIEVEYFNMSFMTLGLNLINSGFLGFTIKIIISVCIFIIVLNILFVCNFIIVLNVLLSVTHWCNYLHYCINAPFDYNCMNVLSSALYLIDFYVLHVLQFNGSKCHSPVRRGKVLGRGGKVELYISLYPP